MLDELNYLNLVLFLKQNAFLLIKTKKLGPIVSVSINFLNIKRRKLVYIYFNISIFYQVCRNIHKFNYCCIYERYFGKSEFNFLV